MSKIKKMLLSLIVIISLSACHDDEQSNMPSLKPQSQLFAQDMVYRTKPNETLVIDISNHVQRSDDRIELSLSEIQLLNPRTDCDDYGFSGSEFVVNLNNIQECLYDYTVKSEDGSVAKAIIRIAASNHTSTITDRVIQFTQVVDKDSTVRIKVLGNQTGIPESFYIDPNSLYVQGAGSAYIDINNPQYIYYKPDQRDQSNNINRIMFSYISHEKEELIQGLISVAVNVTAFDNYYSPKAVNFRFGDMDSYVSGQQLEYIDVQVGEDIIIDVAPYYDGKLLDAAGNRILLTDDQGNEIFDEDNQRIHYFLSQNGSTSQTYTSGSHLIDGDKDKVQLYNVFSYNSYSRIIDDGFFGTKFLFRTDHEGMHYVTYVLSDHNGGFDVGIIEIKAINDPDKNPVKPWWTNFYTSSTGVGGVGGGSFISPLSQQEADKFGLTYDYVTTEIGVSGPNNYGTVITNYYAAYSYCLMQGRELPSSATLRNLRTSYPSGLYLSKDVHNPNTSLRDRAVNWPVGVAFWANDGFTEKASAVNLMNFTVQTELDKNSEYRAFVCSVTR